MKKVLRKKPARGMRFLIAAFVLTACFWNVSVAQSPPVPIVTQQSPCFYVQNNATQPLVPCSGPCTTSGTNCSDCWNFTIFSCDDQEFPDSFKITAEEAPPLHGPACFSVCSPTGDFVDPDHRVDCDPNTKWPVLPVGHANITTTAGASLTICGAPGTIFHIVLVHHSGQSPCASDCKEATISFPR